MIVLGYSGLDASIDFARLDPTLRPGEDRMVQGLDSAAALLVDGQVIAAAAEERFTGEKHTNRFPYHAIRFCLDSAGLGLEEVDSIAHGFHYGKFASLFRHVDSAYYESVLSPARQQELWAARFQQAFAPEKFVSVEHHLAHAASCYFPSGFDEALCVVCDGMGEIAAITVYEARAGKLKPLQSLPIRDSIGILYGIATRHLGFKFNADEYKVMGLAPYGDPSVYRRLFERLLEFAPEGRFRLRWEKWAANGAKGPYYRGIFDALREDAFSPPPETEKLDQQYCDFAASAQECLENALFHVIRHWAAQTGLKQFCMAGGVALNCTFNGKLIASGLFDDVYCQPAAGDDGSAVGAAFIVAAENSGQPLKTAVRPMPFYGPGYAAEEMEAAVSRFAGQVTCVDLGSAEAAADDAAEALMRDEIVAWFQGRMEYGPRALGNRSILANPTTPDIKERLNAIIKLREGFRPFAPAVVEECAGKYFDFVPASPFEFMLATCPVHTQWRQSLPGITHVDGSARAQTVNSQKNPLFHRLIRSFGEKSGVFCVVNTSFNVRGQPMICSPDVAIETFLKVRIDRLYLGSLRISKS